MGTTIAEFTMSLDGYIAGPNDEIDPLFGWYGAGDTEFPVPGVPRSFRISRASAELLREQWGSLGAIVTGRRDFDVSEAWGGTSPLQVPMFIVTHSPPQEWIGRDAPFTFVTGGVESAIEQAKAAAGDKNVAVGGTTIVKQCLEGGLLDEILIHLAPVLLGDGIRLFDRRAGAPIELESTGVIRGSGVTHLRFRVVK